MRRCGTTAQQAKMRGDKQGAILQLQRLLLHAFESGVERATTPWAHHVLHAFVSPSTCHKSCSSASSFSPLLMHGVGSGRGLETSKTVSAGELLLISAPLAVTYHDILPDADNTDDEDEEQEAGTTDSDDPGALDTEEFDDEQQLWGSGFTPSDDDLDKLQQQFTENTSPNLKVRNRQTHVSDAARYIFRLLLVLHHVGHVIMHLQQ